jgi:hypothetical protein
MSYRLKWSKVFDLVVSKIFYLVTTVTSEFSQLSMNNSAALIKMVLGPIFRGVFGQISDNRSPTE